MIARLRGRLAESGGYSLSEMIVVLAILGIVLAALVQLFVSGSNAQADMTNRFQAQQNARLALDGLRREIHCASEVAGTSPDTWITSITIKLGAYCPSYTTGQPYVTWCTKDTSGTFPYTLWRYTSATLPTPPTCPGTGRKWVGSLTTGTVFKTNTAQVGELGSISVDLPVDLTPGDAKQRYELKDDIVLRNTARP
jgi:prepilin-type N-terminal cleavage/methylation domain-containing protein